MTIPFKSELSDTAGNFPEKITKLFINGHWVYSQASNTFKRANPLDSELCTEASAAQVEDALLAVQVADEARDDWRHVGPSERRRLLNLAADELVGRTDQFTKAMQRETGASTFWVQRNVMHAAAIVKEAAALTTRVGGTVIPSDVPGNLSFAIRQPAGVVLGMAPWNAPVALGARAIATPLACGNTVVLKGSEFCPETHALIVEAFQAAGFPPGVINFIVHDKQDAA